MSYAVLPDEHRPSFCASLLFVDLVLTVKFDAPITAHITKHKLRGVPNADDRRGPLVPEWNTFYQYV